MPTMAMEKKTDHVKRIKLRLKCPTKARTRCVTMIVGAFDGRPVGLADGDTIGSFEG